MPGPLKESCPKVPPLYKQVGPAEWAEIVHLTSRLRYTYLKIRGKMQVYNFYQLFKVKNPTTIEARVMVRIGKFQLLPGAEINPGVTIEGINLFNIVGRNLQVEVLVGNVYNILGVQNG